MKCGQGDGQVPVLRPGPATHGVLVQDVDAWRGALRESATALDAALLGPGERLGERPRGRSADCPGYTGWVYALDLGEVGLVDIGSDPVRVTRTRRLIDRDPLDLYHLAVAQRPGQALAGGRHTRLRVGDALLHGSADPWSVTADSFGHFLVINVPRAVLRRDLQIETGMIGQVVPAENPLLRVLTRTVTELGREAPRLPSASLAELGHTVRELLVSTLRLEMAGQEPGTATARSVLLARMREFVHEHLRDPDLSPRMLADAFRVSTRYVELAFRDADRSPARFIRETRMAEARRMLADPRQRHRSIAAIARTVGIPNPTVFARSFRAHYQLTPRDYRHSHTPEAERRSGMQERNAGAE
ncbi:AraC family transcriptional regulator [Streptomyces cinnabarinus]|uniref:AraC family transcriptional regulator n=1 Tax=Streptomyces cinnabarinus TaxID=67287 RepID=A0ABY7KEY4_9ACTN|nr:AraC family transcriptional regulator [Streptomyces cinnabarinus]WAZ23114.1 AraC family transcriptional regulator [Streptomyces cinnabarinus]